jgi:hypothetical protein
MNIGGDITTLPQPPSVGGPYPTPGMMQAPIAPPMMPRPFFPPPPPRRPMYYPYPIYQAPPPEPEPKRCRIQVGPICIGYDGSIDMNYPGKGISIGGKSNPRVTGGSIDFSNGRSSGGLFGNLGNMFGGMFGGYAKANRARANAATFVEQQDDKVPPVPYDLNKINPTMMGMVSRNQPAGLMSGNKLSNFK